MEGVQRKLQSMKLSDAEKEEVQIGRRSATTQGPTKLEAIGKLMFDRSARVDALKTALGRVWCPFKGIECKDLGMNRFLFVFREEAGKRKALDGGPWMFNKKLLVIEDFNPSKTLEEYQFKFTPIWVRLYGIPMGSMCKETGEDIGKEIGEVIDVDVDDCGMAAGDYMRVKVRLDISKPLMRGIIAFDDVEDEGEESNDKVVFEGDDGKEEQGRREITLKYEYLPDFCYLCGIIGHNDKACPNKQHCGSSSEFGPWLKAELWKRYPNGDDRSRDPSDKWGFGKSSSGDSRGSDALSWRKDSVNNGNMEGSGKGEDKMVTSPLKLQSKDKELSVDMRVLDFEVGAGDNTADKRYNSPQDTSMALDRTLGKEQEREPSQNVQKDEAGDRKGDVRAELDVLEKEKAMKGKEKLEEKKNLDEMKVVVNPSPKQTRMRTTFKRRERTKSVQ
nr:uncharacterized protein LOC109756956 [Aegilops tauschii subsp. strangulata]